VNSAYFSVTTTAQIINTDTSVAAGAIGNTIIVKVPAGGITVYIGGSDVTADTTAGTGGFPLAAGDSLAIQVAEGESVYARVASSTQSVNILRQGAN
jgi:hypothetical protein